MIGFIPVIGILCATLLLFWLYPRQVKTGKLADLYSMDAVRSMASLNPNTLEYKPRVAGAGRRRDWWLCSQCLGG